MSLWEETVVATCTQESSKPDRGWLFNVHSQRGLALISCQQDNIQFLICYYFNRRDRRFICCPVFTSKLFLSSLSRSMDLGLGQNWSGEVCLVLREYKERDSWQSIGLVLLRLALITKQNALPAMSIFWFSSFIWLLFRPTLSNELNNVLTSFK